MPSGYELAQNTYKLGAKNDPKDKIEIVIGDEKQEGFFPRVKIKRWDNEVNFSVGLIDEGGTHKIESGKIKYTGNRKANFYSLDDGYEFEEILDKKPKNNILEYSIETKNLDFFYQGELTQEEIDQEAERPENVVGSYAVYHSENPINYVGGKEYKSGKVGHIYRPKIIDANGKEIWGFLNIDIERGILSITIDEEWLNKAKYPVIVDPTFGYTSAGASNQYIPTSGIEGSKFTAPVGCVIDKMTVYAKVEGPPSMTAKMGINYDSNKNFVADSKTNAFTMTGATPAWYNGTYTTHPSLSAADYWLVYGEESIATGKIYYDSGATNQGVRAYNSLGNTFDLPSYTSRKDSIFAVYLPFGSFGYGGSPTDVNELYEHYIVGSKFTAIASGFISSLSFSYLGQTGNTTKCKGAVYDTSGNLLGVTTEFDTTYQGIITANIDGDYPAIVSGTEYILCVWFEYEGGIAYETGATNQGYYKGITYSGNFADPITWSGNDNNKYAIYCNFQTFNSQGPVSIIQVDSETADALGTYEFEGVLNKYDNYFKNEHNWYLWHDTAEYWMLGTSLENGQGIFISAGVGILPDNPWEFWNWTYDPPLVVWGRSFDSYDGESADFALYAAYPKVAQSFTADANGALTSAVFYLNGTGAPTGNIVAKLYAHTGTFGTSSKPTGTALATSDIKDVAEFDGVSTPKVFTFDGSYQLTEGTKYCIVLEYAGGDNQNYVEVRIDATSSSHNGNSSYWYQVGGYYYAEATKDLKFSVYRLGDPLISAIDNQVDLSLIGSSLGLPTLSVEPVKNNSVDLGLLGSSLSNINFNIDINKNATIDDGLIGISAGIINFSVDTIENTNIGFDLFGITGGLPELSVSGQKNNVVNLDMVGITFQTEILSISDQKNASIIFGIVGSSLDLINYSVETTKHVTIDLTPSNSELGVLTSEIESIKNVNIDFDPFRTSLQLNNIGIVSGNSTSIGFNPVGITAGLNDLTILLDNTINFDPIGINLSVLPVGIVISKDSSVDIDTFGLNFAIMDLIVIAENETIIDFDLLGLNFSLPTLTITTFKKPYKRINPYSKDYPYSRPDSYKKLSPYSNLKTYTKRDYDN